MRESSARAWPELPSGTPEEIVGNACLWWKLSRPSVGIVPSASGSLISAPANSGELIAGAAGGPPAAGTACGCAKGPDSLLIHAGVGFGGGNERTGRARH